MRKNCSCDYEHLLKFEAEEDKESATFLRSLEDLFEPEKDRKVLETECFFNLFLDVSQIW